MVYIMVEQIIYNTGVTSSMKRNGLSHEEAGRLGAEQEGTGDVSTTRMLEH